MKIAEALYELGVREDTLTVEEKAQLDRDGYLPIRGVLTPEHLEAIRQRQEELLAAEGQNAGKEVHQEAGTDRLSDLINKGEMYHIVITHPKLLAGIAHVLKGDLKLSSLNSRTALPGQGRQGLHADWSRLETPGDYQVCNSVWLLDDFMLDNGATRVVPGTHRGGKLPSDEMASPADPHSNEVVLLGKAGDVVIFNAHTWHGGTLNTTGSPRRAMHGYFTRRHQTQQLDQKRYLRPETAAQLSEAARTVLGVEGDYVEGD
jgi:ectoine hydroxylase-related dioxygenase (phytanoyl-CoA dioxygenase family)